MPATAHPAGSATPQDGRGLAWRSRMTAAIGSGSGMVLPAALV
jgi:hypothetical protein